MQKVSDAVKAAYRDDSFLADMIVEIDGETFTDSDILDGSPKIEESLCSQDSLNFTAVESSSFSCTLLTDKDPAFLKEKTVQVFQNPRIGGLFLGDSTFLGPETFLTIPEPNVLLGTFVISDSTISGDGMVDIEACDLNKTFIDTVIDGWWNDEAPFPLTIRGLLIGLAGYVGIETDLPQSWPNSDLEVMQNAYLENTSAAELLGMIQEVSGRFFRCGRDGVLRMIDPGSVETTEITYDLIHEDPDISSFTVPAIDKLQIHASDDDDGVIVGTGSNAYISTGNILVYGLSQEELEAVAENALSAMAEFQEYRPFSATVTNLAYLEPGDPIVIETASEIRAFAYLFAREMSGSGLVEDSIDVPGEAERDNNPSPLKSTVYVLNRRTHKLVISVEELSSELTSVSTEQKGTVKAQSTYWLQTVSPEKPETTDSRWSLTPGVFVKGNHVWQMTVTTYVDPDREPHYSDPVEITSPTVVNVETYYMLSSSMTEAKNGYLYLGPDTFLGYSTFMIGLWGGDWQKDPPPFIPGHYLWTRQRVTYSDGTVEWLEPTCNAQSNDVFASVTKNSTRIDQTDEEIKLKADRTELTSSYNDLSHQIETERIEREASIDLTAKEIDLKVQSVSESRASSFTIYYISLPEGETPAQDDERWTEDDVPWVDGMHVWQMTKTVYGSGENERIVYSRPVDITGAKGNDGANADPLEITAQSVTYQISDSGTDIPDGEWSTSIPSVSPGKFLWTRTHVEYSDGTETDSYSVTMQAHDGEQGVGIESEEIYYKTSTSKTDWSKAGYLYLGPETYLGIRTFMTEAIESDLEWSADQPEYTPGHYLWTKRHINYTDGSTQDIYACELQMATIYDIVVKSSADVKILDESVSIYANRLTDLQNAFDSYTIEEEAKIDVLVDEIYLAVSQKIDADQAQSMIDMKADSIIASVQSELDGYTKKAEIIMDINADGSAVKISADKINLQGIATFMSEGGFVTDDDLSENGVTVIDGARIQTGIISDESGLNFWNLNTGEMKIALVSQLQQQVDGIDIARNNLLVGTQDYTGWGYTNEVTFTDGDDGFKVAGILNTSSGMQQNLSGKWVGTLAAGKTYTLSVMAYGNAPSMDVTVHCKATDIKQSEGTAAAYSSSFVANFPLSQSRVKKVVTFTAAEDSTSQYVDITVPADIQFQTANVYAFKLEEGDSATSWTPSYNEGYVVKAEIIAAINDDFQSELKIKADKISLEGIITANGNIKITEDGSLVAKNGTFSGSITGSTIAFGDAYKVTMSSNSDGDGVLISGTGEIGMKSTHDFLMQNVYSDGKIANEFYFANIDTPSPSQTQTSYGIKNYSKNWQEDLIGAYTQVIGQVANKYGATYIHSSYHASSVSFADAQLGAQTTEDYSAKTPSATCYLSSMNNNGDIQAYIECVTGTTHDGVRLQSLNCPISISAYDEDIEISAQNNSVFITQAHGGTPFTGGVVQGRTQNHQYMLNWNTDGQLEFYVDNNRVRTI